MNWAKPPPFQEGIKNKNILLKGPIKVSFYLVTTSPELSVKYKSSFTSFTNEHFTWSITSSGTNKPFLKTTYRLSFSFPIKTLSPSPVIGTLFGFLPKYVYLELQLFDPE